MLGLKPVTKTSELNDKAPGLEELVRRYEAHDDKRIGPDTKKCKLVDSLPESLSETIQMEAGCGAYDCDSWRARAQQYLINHASDKAAMGISNFELNAQKEVEQMQAEMDKQDQEAQARAGDINHGLKGAGNGGFLGYCDNGWKWESQEK